MVEGQDGFDTLVFNGAAGAESFDASASGQRLRFFRTQGNIVMDVDGTERDDAAACAPVASPLRLVQALTDTAAPLFLVTSGAQSATADDHTTDPFAAALWGFGRVVGAERPDLRCRLVDVTPETPPRPWPTN